jgi:hypothetical protein
MWRAVFLHEFLDENIRNFQALPGNATPASLTLTPSPAPQLKINSVELSPGRGFEYSLVESLDEVIGVSGSIKLWYPIDSTVGPTIPFIMHVGDMAQFQARPFVAFPGTAQFFGHLGIGSPPSPPLELGKFTLSNRRFVDIRFDWHTSGQARILLDGRLVLYHNGVAPTAQLEVANVKFGVPEGSAPGFFRYHVGGVFARVLRRSDSLAAVSGSLPVVDVPADDLFEQCRVRTAINLLAMVDRLRHFMTLVNQQLSQPWSQDSGPPEGPFSADAIKAHQLAAKASVELRTMLRTGDFSAPDSFLSPFTAFLKILHDAVPAEFEALAEDLIKTPVVPEVCRQVFEAALEQAGQELRPLLELFSVASNRISEIAGGS